MAYDSAENKVLLFGGYTGSANAETWTYDTASNTWSDLNPATRPSQRYSLAVAYDQDIRKIVLFGCMEFA